MKAPLPSAATLPSFGHSRRARTFWEGLTRGALRRSSTPLYVFSATPIGEALQELSGLDTVARATSVGVRHWLSCKTQPIRPLLSWWRARGLPVEVVSEFEYLAARATGFAPDQILVNGPAKHCWLPRHAARGLNVNFDSTTEAEALLPIARKLQWRLGVRVLTGQEFDPEDPSRPTQFGLEPGETVRLLRRLRRAGVRLETVHFHLRTNVRSPRIYERAIAEIADLCAVAAFAPRHLDVGGGLPPPHVLSRGGQHLDAHFDLSDWAAMLARSVRRFPGLRELWLENGRFVSARAGVLVVTVLDIKDRRGLRQLICDGGRTLNALVSSWEAHELLVLPRRRGEWAPTAVCGPTCMAFDQLAVQLLPRNIRCGDRLLWMDAGAYHIPWETRFSHGSAAVVWHDGRRLQRVRPAESFESWWGQWRNPENTAARLRP